MARMEFISRWQRLAPKLGLWGGLYLLLLPALCMLLLFGYWPKLDVAIKSLYRWQPSIVQEFVGLQNFRDAWADPLFWQSFQLVGILLIANIFKLIPGILVAICMHRLASDRWRQALQVCFVIPMVIPGIVWLLVWKSFYDPDFGLLNAFLNQTGLMQLLAWMDGADGAPGWVPRLAQGVEPLMGAFVRPVFGGAWGLILAGSLFWGLGRIWGRRRRRAEGAGPAPATGLAEGLCWTAWGLMGLGISLACLMAWDSPTGQFVYGKPAWLGSTDLIVPAIILWGFPWVGTVGVLIYLSGLQQISPDVYEAARLDGVGPIRQIFAIELPLIMTQIRINLILMTIHLFAGYELFLVLLGPSGGAGNAGMVPGLYMFKTAFIDSRFGYACALGMILFVIILGLTIVYNRYVKVDK
ncbi:MAG: carbohydrate ABC transporter permease [Opitutales bacterium]